MPRAAQIILAELRRSARNATSVSRYALLAFLLKPYCLSALLINPTVRVYIIYIKIQNLQKSPTFTKYELWNLYIIQNEKTNEQFETIHVFLHFKNNRRCFDMFGLFCTIS